MTFLIEIENKPDSNASPYQYAIINTENKSNTKVYLSRVSFKEINDLNGLNFLNDFLSQICNYCNKAIQNETRNDYRIILLCGHHYHTECICKCAIDHINIVRCINCFEKMEHVQEIVKYTYSTYDINSNNVGYVVNKKLSNSYPLIYKRMFHGS